jgi:hypothetical protein
MPPVNIFWINRSGCFTGTLGKFRARCRGSCFMSSASTRRFQISSCPEDRGAAELVAGLRETHALYYSKIGRPSIDPVLMIRMLIIG